MLIPTVALEATCNTTMDSTVEQNNPTLNFGSATILTLGKHNGRRSEIFIKFDLTPLEGLGAADIESAQLAFTISSLVSLGDSITERMFEAYEANEDWTEDTVTWQNKPAGFEWITTFGIDEDQLVAGATFNIDVTRAVKHWLSGTPNYGIYLKVTDNVAGDGSVFFTSKEGNPDERPKLIVEYTQLTPPPTAFDYNINPTQPSINLIQGQQATTAIEVTLTEGSPQPVTLTLSGLPADASYTFNPSTVTPSAASILTITAGQTTGTYTLTIQASSAELTQTTIVILTITQTQTATMIPLTLIYAAIAIIAIIAVTSIVLWKHRKPPPPPPPSS